MDCEVVVSKSAFKCLDNIRGASKTPISPQMQPLWICLLSFSQSEATHSEEKYHKYFQEVQISIPAVAKCLDNIRGASKTQTSLKNTGCEIEFQRENILGLHNFWTKQIEIL